MENSLDMEGIGEDQGIHLVGTPKCPINHCEEGKEGDDYDGTCERCQEPPNQETIEHVLRGCYKAELTWVKVVPKGMSLPFMCMDWDNSLLNNLKK